MEKNMKKKKVYMCITEALCCTSETNNIVNKLTIKKIHI